MEVRWSRRFESPISLPDGRKITTLRDAGRYIEALPKAKQRDPKWLLATEMLLKAVDGQPVMFADIAFRKALGITSEPRKKTAKTYRIVR